jgi:hypothetical protein
MDLTTIQFVMETFRAGEFREFRSWTTPEIRNSPGGNVTE